MGYEHGLIEHVGIATVYLHEQSVRGTDMKTEFGIDGGISRDMMVDDTGVYQAIAVGLHILLQRTKTETAENVRIYGEPFSGDLRLEVHVRRGSKRDIIRAG